MWNITVELNIHLKLPWGDYYNISVNFQFSPSSVSLSFVCIRSMHIGLWFLLCLCAIVVISLFWINLLPFCMLFLLLSLFSFEHEFSTSIITCSSFLYRAPLSSSNIASFTFHLVSTLPHNLTIRSFCWFYAIDSKSTIFFCVCLLFSIVVMCSRFSWFFFSALSLVRCVCCIC